MMAGDRSTIVAMLPVALAIAVFGVVYGVVARSLMGPWLALASSMIVYSGALQFTSVGLATAGAGPAAILLAACGLNMRHVLLGAILRPRVKGGALRRALVAWFLVDESFGLAITSEGDAGRTLVVSGLLAYAAWLAGTALGVLGASADALAGPAEAAFPVLFIGLAAVSSSSGAHALRAVAGAGLTGVVVIAWPAGSGFAPLLGALAASLLGPRR